MHLDTDPTFASKNGDVSMIHGILTFEPLAIFQALIGLFSDGNERISRKERRIFVALKWQLARTDRVSNTEEIRITVVTSLLSNIHLAFSCIPRLSSQFPTQSLLQ
jgi:hypothetical protein